jgi:hypothetical protein
MYMYWRKYACPGLERKWPGTKKLTKNFPVQKKSIFWKCIFTTFSKNAFFRNPFFDNVANHPEDNMEREEGNRYMHVAFLMQYLAALQEREYGMCMLSRFHFFCIYNTSNVCACYSFGSLWCCK